MTFRPRTGLYWACAAMLLGFAIFCGWAAGISRPLDRGDTIAIVVTLAIFLPLGAGCVWMALVMRKERYVVGDNGVTLPDGRSVAWHDVRSVTSSVDGYVLWAPDGSKTELPAMVEMEPFKELVERHMLAALLPRFEKRVLENKRVDFGPFAIEDGKLHHGSKHVALDGGTRVLVEIRWIEVRRDGASWVRVPAHLVHDSFVLAFLVNRGESPVADAPG